ncbi:MAG: porin, partial [Pseudomonadota bacterium]|nr:porin [Pseudomonadota bacterium]
SPGDQGARIDLGNGQIFVNKNEGLIQYFLELGAYSIPAIGTPYLSASSATRDFYGVLAQGFLKIALTGAFSVEAGALPTLIGAEDTFSFENMNIDRGLLWNQENSVARGVQVNYTRGPVAFALSLNDGFYSKHYSWVTGSATWTINKTNTLEFARGGNAEQTNISTAATPLFQNNEQIYNLIYTHTHGSWTFQPYAQYTHVPSISAIGPARPASTYGGAMLIGYAFDTKSSLAGFSLPVRLEYIGSSGSLAHGAANLLYGPGSSAWSVTVTPTYQYKIYFVRAELAYIGASSTTAGLAFGPRGLASSQTRGLVETGLLF